MRLRMRITYTAFDTGCAITLERPSAQYFEQWKEFRTAFLVWSFVGRPALAITLSPQPNSWSKDLAERLHCELERFTFGGVDLEAICLDTCPGSLLEDAGTEEDFWRGLLWFSSPTADVNAQVESIYRAKTSAVESSRVTPYEALSCDNDGRTLLWCRPCEDRRAQEFLRTMESRFDLVVQTL
jgi:hypothetical protein